MKEMSSEGKLLRQTAISNNKSVVDVYWYYDWRWYDVGYRIFLIFGHREKMKRT